MKQLLRVLPIIVLSLFIFSSPASAFYIQKGGDITLPKNKTFNETVIIAGSNLTIDSTINGDLICAGRNIILTGAVKGDLICAGQDIKINGPVDGNIRLAGQMVDLSSTASRNLTLIGQTLNLLKTSIIKQDLIVAGQDVNISSNISRDVLAAGQRIKVLPDARIAGKFDYYLEPNTEASIAANTVKGAVTKHLLPQHYTSPQLPPDLNQAKKAFSAVSRVISVMSILVGGIFLILISRRRLEHLSSNLKSSAFVVGFLGFAIIFLTPVLSFVLLMTFVGIPLALILLLIYFLGFFLSIPLASIAVSQKLVPSSNLFLDLLLGTSIFILLDILPGVGWFFGLLFLCYGFGLFFHYLVDNFHSA